MDNNNPTSPHWHRTRSEPGPDLKLFKVRFDWMVNPRNGHEEKMILLEGGNSVQVVAETATGEILLVKQYRFGVREYLYELPGGLIDAGEDPLTAARRELLEETGYRASLWNSLGSHPSNPAFMEGFVHHFSARNVILAGALQMDDGEDIRLVAMPRDKVKQRLLTGGFKHPHTVCALLAFFAEDFS
jgi:8-oxo-dGTP pyrophosphatase MutT (NUDIX family)